MHGSRWNPLVLVHAHAPDGLPVDSLQATSLRINGGLVRRNVSTNATSFINGTGEEVEEVRLQNVAAALST